MKKRAIHSDVSNNSNKKKSLSNELDDAQDIWGNPVSKKHKIDPLFALLNTYNEKELSEVINNSKNQKLTEQD